MTIVTLMSQIYRVSLRIERQGGVMRKGLLLISILMSCAMIAKAAGTINCTTLGSNVDQALRDVNTCRTIASQSGQNPSVACQDQLTAYNTIKTTYDLYC